MLKAVTSLDEDLTAVTTLTINWSSLNPFFLKSCSHKAFALYFTKHSGPVGSFILFPRTFIPCFIWIERKELYLVAIWSMLSQTQSMLSKNVECCCLLRNDFHIFRAFFTFNEIVGPMSHDPISICQELKFFGRYRSVETPRGQSYGVKFGRSVPMSFWSNLE